MRMMVRDLLYPTPVSLLDKMWKGQCRLLAMVHLPQHSHSGLKWDAVHGEPQQDLWGLVVMALSVDYYGQFVAV